MQKPKRKPEPAEIWAIWRARLHPDRVGVLVGLCMAMAVMALGFWRGTGFLDVLYRTALAFVVSWLVTFAAVFVVYHISDRELAPPPEPSQEAEDLDKTSPEGGAGEQE